MRRTIQDDEIDGYHIPATPICCGVSIFAIASRLLGKARAVLSRAFFSRVAQPRAHVMPIYPLYWPSCLYRQYLFATTEMQLVLATIAQRYRVSLVLDTLLNRTNVHSASQTWYLVLLNADARECNLLAFQQIEKEVDIWRNAISDDDSLSLSRIMVVGESRRNPFAVQAEAANARFCPEMECATMPPKILSIIVR